MGCNSGDLLTCSRVADEYPNDLGGQTEARGLREQVCRMAAAITAESPARDLRASAEACPKLGAMYASGAAGSVNPVRALELETLATLVRVEVLRRLTERDQREAFITGVDAAIKASARPIEPPRAPRFPCPLSNGSSRASRTRPNPAKAEPQGDEAAACRETGARVSCALAGSRSRPPTAPVRSIST